MHESEHLPIPRLTPAKRRLYEAFLKVGVGNRVSLPQLREAMGVAPHEQQQLRRRIQEMEEEGFDIPQEGYRDGEYLYVLKSEFPVRPPKPRGAVSQKLRAQVLNEAAGRCQMCGATVYDDGVKLVVDHKIPASWGGGSDLANLWALCETCNSGKRDFFRSIDSNLMRRCMSYPEEPRRIGELLKAFTGKAPPRYLLGVVGGGSEWTKRLRQLRLLGWHIEKVWSREEGNWTYRLVRSRPWPPNVWKAIKEAEERERPPS